MNIVIFGGTGSIGRALIQDLIGEKDHVWVVTRNRLATADMARGNVEIIEWDYHSPLPPACQSNDLDAVINLAGKSIGAARWTHSVKQEILDSRTKTTRAVVTAINTDLIQPKVLINASAVGYYGPREEEVSENDRPGSDFLAEVCQNWEEEAYEVQKDSTRVVTVRIGVVLDQDGALKKMVMPFKFFMGGPIGSGTQWLSWIHKHDLVRIFRFIIDHKDMCGPVNATAPNPVRMRQFSKVLGEVIKKPSWFPVPGFILDVVLGQMSEMVLHGQQAIPEKLLHTGFEFRFPDLKEALADILQV